MAIDSSSQSTFNTIINASFTVASQRIYTDNNPTIRTSESGDLISSKKHIQSPWCHSTQDAIIHFNLNQPSQNAPLYWLLYPRLVGLYIPYRINQGKLIPANNAWLRHCAVTQACSLANQKLFSTASFPQILTKLLINILNVVLFFILLNLFFI